MNNKNNGGINMKRLDETIQPFPMTNLAIIRQKCNMTQQQLSIKLGFSQELISKYESGRSSPSVSSLLKIADFFHCSIDYLLQKTDNPCTPSHLSQDTAILVSKYHVLSARNKDKLAGYLDALIELQN